MSSRPAIDLTPPAATVLDGRCVYWCALLVFGFAYVAMVLCQRALPFASDNNAWGDWLGVVLSGPTLYQLGARHTLRTFGKEPASALRWNVLGFGLPFFAALHWEWVGKLTGANYSLTTRHLSHLDAASRIGFAVQVVLTVAVAALCLREARRESFLTSYLCSFAGLIVVLAAITCALGPRYHVHVHHYFFALCLIPFVRFRHPVCFVTQAMLAGAFVEGACRWGLDPVWIAGR